MTEQEKYELFERVIGQQGITHQLILAMEEMAELQQALSKWMRGPTDGEDIAEEVADVEIMLEQIKHMFANQIKVTQWKEKKLERLNTWINNAVCVIRAEKKNERWID